MSVLGDSGLADGAASAAGQRTGGRPTRVRPVGIGVAVAAVVAALGPLLGLVWREAAPRVAGALRWGCGYSPVVRDFGYAQCQPEQAFAADGWFTFLGVGVGAVLALLAWVLLSHHRGLPVLLGLVLGSVVAAWLAWLVGVQLDQDRFEAAARGVTEPGTVVEAPLTLRVTHLDPDRLWPPRPTGVVLAQALAAAVVYTTLAVFSTDPGLRPASMRSSAMGSSATGPAGEDTDPQAPFSWGPDVPTGRPESPAPPGSA